MVDLHIESRVNNFITKIEWEHLSVILTLFPPFSKTNVLVEICSSNNYSKHFNPQQVLY